MTITYSWLLQFDITNKLKSINKLRIRRIKLIGAILIYNAKMLKSSVKSVK